MRSPSGVWTFSLVGLPLRRPVGLRVQQRIPPTEVSWQVLTTLERNLHWGPLSLAGFPLPRHRKPISGLGQLGTDRWVVRGAPGGRAPPFAKV